MHSYIPWSAMDLFVPRLSNPAPHRVCLPSQRSVDNGLCVNFALKMSEPNKRSDEKFFGVSAKASLWLLLPRVTMGIAASTAFVLALFWMQFGEVNSFTILIATAAGVFQILLLIGLRHSENVRTAESGNIHGPVSKIGAFWLIAVFFGSILGWFTGDLAAADSEYALALHVATVILTIVLPIMTSIPNYRYVTFANAHITIPMLFIVSLLPSLVGWRSVAAVWKHFFK